MTSRSRYEQLKDKMENHREINYTLLFNALKRGGNSKRNSFLEQNIKDDSDNLLVILFCPLVISRGDQGAKPHLLRFLPIWPPACKHLHWS